MPDQDLNARLLSQLVNLTKQERNEICCKLREVIAAMGEDPTVEVVAGMLVLQAGANFNVNASNYRSVSMAVVDAAATTNVVVVSDAGTANVGYKGYSASWSIDKGVDLGISNLSITAATGSTVIINYTKIA